MISEELEARILLRAEQLRGREWIEEIQEFIREHHGLHYVAPERIIRYTVAYLQFRADLHPEQRHLPLYDSL